MTVHRSRRLVAVLLISIAIPIFFCVACIHPHPPDRVTLAMAFHIIAHRGASASAPENTLAAFSKGVDGIETDHPDMLRAILTGH